jgi:hypothetical protein
MSNIVGIVAIVNEVGLMLTQISSILNRVGSGEDISDAELDAAKVRNEQSIERLRQVIQEKQNNE